MNENQHSNICLPSTSADDYTNDPILEEQWAMKAFQHAETYFNLLCAVEPKCLRLSRHDDQIYSRFRETFPDLKIDVLLEDQIKSDDAKKEWRSFCDEFREKVEDYNFGTLVRIDSKGEYTNENTFLVVRIQFYAIEIARNREGHNDSIRKLSIMTRWDNLHERYFNYLSILSFDKAKEVLEKDASKINQDYFRHLFVLVQLERSYHNFGFASSQRNNNNNNNNNNNTGSKNKSLFQCYSDFHLSLIEEQSSIKQTNSAQITSDEAKEIAHLQQLTTGLITFLSVRTQLMKLYEQISNAIKRNEHNVRLENFVDDIEHISQSDMSSLNTLILSPMLRLLKHEVDCLLLLIRGFAFISDYQYTHSISTLHHMQYVLKEWNDNIENQQNGNNRFLLSSASALNFFKTPTKPALFSFYSKFHELLVTKFSLYFADILYECGGPDSKAPIGKANSEFYTRIAHSYRRLNIEWVAMVLHTDKTRSDSIQTDPLADEHILPTTAAASNGGKDFQLIFGYPNKPNATDEITKQIISKVEINYEMLRNGDKIFYSGDVNQTRTYFLQNIDPRITFALIFASHRQERDAAITNFLAETIDLLRGSRLFSYFKNGTK